jgi:8-oxo-dGTP pyrophosphatase MutT (NUDIX family)
VILFCERRHPLLGRSSLGSNRAASFCGRHDCTLGAAQALHEVRKLAGDKKGRARGPHAADLLRRGLRMGVCAPCRIAGFNASLLDAVAPQIFYDNPTPVVAAIVEHQESRDSKEPAQVVLVRSHGWPESFFGLVSAACSTCLLCRFLRQRLLVLLRIGRAVRKPPFTDVQVTGFLEKGEAAEEGVVREVQEELGLSDVERQSLIGMPPLVLARALRSLVAHALASQASTNSRGRIRSSSPTT